MTDETVKQTLMQDIVLMKLVGINPVIVHGGGPEITGMLKKIGKETRFINGLRVTDEETVEIAEMVLSGKINKEIVGNIQKNGVNAVGISGKDGQTFCVEKMLVNGEDAGYIGKITQVNTGLVETMIKNAFIPVIAPIGADENQETYNINADYAAIAMASALKAEKLVFLTDVEGVMRDILDSSSIISKLSVKEIPAFIEDGTISGGMIPKIECCIQAIEQGVQTVHILDGRLEHSLLLEIFTQKGVGTMIEP
jgi:acetylglutamate kinase